jgi:putative heme iron utilization protein
MAELAASEAEILAHMNADHADTIALFAERLLGISAPGAGDRAWRMTGIDPEGCDLRRGPEVARIDFATPVLDAEAARAELVRLAASARGRA